MLVVLNSAGKVLLERRPPTGVWGGLWSLPEPEADRDPADWCRDRLGGLPRRVEKLPGRRHTFSHFHLDITPVCVDLESEAEATADDNRFTWCDPHRPGELGLAAPVVRILQEITEPPRRDEGESP